MQNIQRKLDRLLQRESIDFINHENAGRRVKAWEDFFSQVGPTLPPFIAVKDTDHQIIDDIVMKAVRDLLGLAMSLPQPLLMHPDKATADAIHACLLTPRLTAAILCRIRKLGGTGVAGACPYPVIKNRSDIAEPYFLLLLDVAAEIEPATPHPDSTLVKVARAYRNAPAMIPRIMQKRTNGQRTGYENMKEQMPAMER
ncbi:MAG: hypothetical protein WC205_18350 [Opitutaceae bacterium]|jgi:hypothetical protein